MLQFASEWLRGLILVIFLAIILDMILPSNATQRYARVVMGLMILFLMLTPVLKLYHNSGSPDFSIDTLLHASQDSLPSIGQIEQQGQHMQQKDAGLTAEEWKSKVVQAVKTQVEQNSLLTVTGVNINYSVDAAGQPQALNSIQVTVTPRKDPHQVQPIKPIDPVKIGETDPAESQADQQALSQAERVQTNKIRNLIADSYNINSSQVKVIWQNS